MLMTQKKYDKYVKKINQLKTQIGGEIKNIGVYIGRFQPLHYGHCEIIKYGLDKYDHLIVFVGSANIYDKYRNPYTAFLRRDFILGYVRDELKEFIHKITVIPLNNHNNTETIWTNKFNQNILSVLQKNNPTINKDNYQNNYKLSLLGSEKDIETQHYLNLITQYTIVKNTDFYRGVKESGNVINATDIRIILNQNETNIDSLKNFVPKSVIELLKNHIKYNKKKPKIQTILKYIYELNNDEKENIFVLYKNTYKDIENDTNLFINNNEELFNRYTDVVYFLENDKIIGGILSNKRLSNNSNKLSVIFVDGSKWSIKYIYDVFVKLLVSGGYIVEASGKLFNNLIKNYKLHPLSFEESQQILPSLGIEKITNIEKANNHNAVYKRKFNNRNIYKSLFGSQCSTNTIIKSAVIHDGPLHGCHYLIDEKPTYSYNTIFENIFDKTCKLTFLNKFFIPYSDLNSDAVVSNLVEEHEIKLHDIDDYDSFDMDKNKFCFTNLLEDNFREMGDFFDEFKNSISLNKNYILNEGEKRNNVRITLENYVSNLKKNNKEKFIKMFGSDIYNNPNINLHVFIDSVPRDTNPENTSSMFKSINLVHVDIYPNVQIGDVVWSFRNTWYNKLESKIDLKNLKNIENRNYWNNKVAGIFNIWINLTDEITDSGLCILDCHNIPNGDLIPYKAFRNGNTPKDNTNFISSSVAYNPKQKWCTKYRMKYGEAFVFNTKYTPHSGFNFINGSEKHRKSMECRIIFMQNINDIIIK
jgi:cytidyltransferase-like protein